MTKLSQQNSIVSQIPGFLGTTVATILSSNNLNIGMLRIEIKLEK